MALTFLAVPPSWEVFLPKQQKQAHSATQAMIIEIIPKAIHNPKRGSDPSELSPIISKMIVVKSFYN